MLEFMSNHIVLSVILIIVIIAIIAVITFYVIKRYSFSRIREEVYKLFSYAEVLFKESGTGQEKLNYVVAMARGLLPPILQKLISERALKKVIQLWFDEVKDYLDDGKFNDSNRGGSA